MLTLVLFVDVVKINKEEILAGKQVTQTILATTPVLTADSSSKKLELRSEGVGGHFVALAE